MRRGEKIKQIIRDGGGEATVGDIYGPLLDEMKDEIRKVNETLEYLVQQGQLIVTTAGRYRLTGKPDGRKRTANALFWRAAHQLSLRGVFGVKDVMEVTDKAKRSVQTWLKEMVDRGHIHDMGGGRYRIKSDAPHRDNPPEFKWPRRHKKA